MSETRDVSEQSVTAQGAANPSAPAEAQPRGGHSGRWIRLLATVGALVFAYAMWVPWAVVTVTQGDRLLLRQLADVNVLVAAGALNPGDPNHPLLTTNQMLVALAVFSMLGVLLAPLLWRPANSLLGAIASHVFGLWVLFGTLLVVGVNFLPQSALDRVLRVSGIEALFTVALDLTLGYWLAVVALIALWIAVIALLASEWRRHAFWHLPGNDNETPRSFIQLPGASVLNLGLIIWAVGFLVIGWASLNCTQTLLIGSCQGIPASSALFAEIAQTAGHTVVTSAHDPRTLLFLDPNIARYAIGILLGVGAALIFLGVWMRAVTRTFCVWTALWLVAAVALVGLAYSGVGLIIAHPTVYGLPAGVWAAQSGVFVALLGLIIAIAGLATLAVAALRKTAE